MKMEQIVRFTADWAFVRAGYKPITHEYIDAQVSKLEKKYNVTCIKRDHVGFSGGLPELVFEGTFENMMPLIAEYNGIDSYKNQADLLKKCCYPSWEKALEVVSNNKPVYHDEDLAKAMGIWMMNNAKLNAAKTADQQTVANEIYANTETAWAMKVFQNLNLVTQAQRASLLMIAAAIIRSQSEALRLLMVGKKELKEFYSLYESALKFCNIH